MKDYNESVKRVGNKKAVFRAMGMNVDKTEYPNATITNHRFRGLVRAKNNDVLFMEFTMAHRLDIKYYQTKEEQKVYSQKYPHKDYLHIDFCFRVDNPLDYYNNHSSAYIDYDRKSRTELPYIRESVITVLKELNDEYEDFEIVNDYDLDGFIDELGFKKMYDMPKVTTIEKITEYNVYNHEISIAKMTLLTTYTDDFGRTFEERHDIEKVIDDEFVEKFGRREIEKALVGAKIKYIEVEK